MPTSSPRKKNKMNTNNEKNKNTKKMSHDTMVKEIQRVINECDNEMIHWRASGYAECIDDIGGIEEIDIYDDVYRTLALDDDFEPIYDAIKEELGVECAEYWRDHASDFTTRQGGNGFRPNDVSYVDEVYEYVKYYLEYSRKPLTKEFIKCFVDRMNIEMKSLGKVFVENLESNKRGYSEMDYLGDLSEKRTLGYTLVKAKIDKEGNVLLKIRKGDGDETSNLDDDLIETLCKVAA